MTDRPTYEELRTRVAELERIAFDSRQAEEAVRRSEETYRHLVENLNDVLYALDAGGVITYVSPSVHAVLGFTPTDLLGRHFEDLIHPEDLEAVRRSYHDVLQGRLGPSEYRVRTRDGGYRWVRTSSRPAVEGDRIAGLQGVLTDISEQKAAEARLRRSEEALQRTLNATTDGIWTWNFQTNALSFSSRYYTMLGYEPGAFPADYEHWVALIHPEDREQALRTAETYLETKPNEYENEFRLRTQNGHYRWIRAHARVAERDAQGNALYMIGNHEDITERKKAEERLQQQHRFLQLLIDAVPVSIFYKDPHGKYIGCNATYAGFLGRPKEEIIGKGVHELFPEELADTYHRMDRELFENPGAQRYEAEMLRADGTRRDVLFNKATYVDASGRVAGLIGAMLDVSERKEMEHRLQQAQKMEAVGTLAGGIAHDFNNILSAILGFTEMVQEDLPEGSRNQEDLAEVITACNRAKDLVKQILTFSRRSEQRTRPLRMDLIVREALKMLRSSLPTSISIHPALAHDLPMVVADPTQIHQIMMNLCANAAQALKDEHGAIYVSLDPVQLGPDEADRIGHLLPGPHVRLRIRDTGTGIPPDIQDRIFEPYFTTKNRGEGTGLGLSVVYGIVHKVGGAVTVESEPGRGATFRVYLPASGQEETETASVEPSALPRGRERILFVDDEPPITRLAKGTLERLGYRVTTRQNATDALELLREDPLRFDLLITDMTMPHMTGDELAAEVLSLRPDLPVVLCTGYSRRISESRARELGVRAFVMKPLTQTDLARTVRRALDAPFSGPS